MAITSAFQADDAGSIPAARSSFKAKSPLLRVGFLFFICLVRRSTSRLPFLSFKANSRDRKGARGAFSDQQRSGSLFLLQLTTETVAFAVDGGDDLRSIVDAFEVLANATDGHIDGTVVGLELTAGHLL